MKIEEALAKFLIQIEADGRSRHTIRQYERHIRLFSHWVREVRPCGDVSKISHEDVALFLSSPLARTRPDGRVKKASSANALRSSLKGFFQYLNRAGYIVQDPGRLIRRAISLVWVASTEPIRIGTSLNSPLMARWMKGSSFSRECSWA